MTTGISSLSPAAGVSEIWPVYVPGARPCGFAVMVKGTGTRGLAVPVAGAAVSQAPDAVRAAAVKLTRPLPSLETFKVCDDAGDPCPNAYDKVSGRPTSFGGAPGSTVTLTATVLLGGFATGEEMVTTPLYVPGATPSGSTRICAVEGILPVRGVALKSQSPCSAIV